MVGGKTITWRTCHKLRYFLPQVIGQSCLGQPKRRQKKKYIRKLYSNVADKNYRERQSTGGSIIQTYLYSKLHWARNYYVLVPH